MNGQHMKWGSIILGAVAPPSSFSVVMLTATQLNSNNIIRLVACGHLAVQCSCKFFQSHIKPHVWLRLQLSTSRAALLPALPVPYLHS